MSDVSDLSDQLDGLKGEWKKLKVKAVDRDAKLKEAAKHAKHFHTDADNMLAWLQLNEEKLDGASPVGLEKDVVAKQLKETQVCFQLKLDHSVLCRNIAFDSIKAVTLINYVIN